MRHLQATAPWNAPRTAGTSRRGRPRRSGRAPKERPGCIWPDQPGGKACRKQVSQNLALCPQHAKVLGMGGGATCAWPGCSQPAPFRSLCSYHHKRALGLMEGGR
jgi:hypothetical protein